VVVVSWNSERFLDECLSSLFRQSGISLEVVVVDNGSTDASIPIVKEKYPGARLIELGSNRGFCAANNAGLGETRGRFVLFANSDIILADGFAKGALAPFSRDERIGLVGGKLLRFDRRTIDSAGQFMTRSRRVVERGYDRPDGRESDGEGYVFSICGAALLCRREMIEDISVGGQLFDESFFAFSEDFDIGWRARLAGWRAWYAPRAVAYHFRGGSETSRPGTRKLPALLRRPRPLRYHIIKNRWLTLLKNDAAASVLRDFPFILARDLSLLGAVTLTSPAVLLDLARSGSLLRGAIARRREFLSGSGRWGGRRAGARRGWVRWREPMAGEPDGPDGDAGGGTA
jgi:GT2 family glycosyltransferase